MAMLIGMRRRWIALFAGLLVVAAMSAAAHAQTKAPVVQLGSGHASVFRWQVLAARDHGAHGDRRPCVEIRLVRHSESSGGETAEACGPVRPQPNGQALVNEVAEPNVAVVAMAFSPEVSSVRLFVSGRSKRYKLGDLSSAQAAKSGLAPFNYLTKAFVGPFCLERFVTYSASGRVLDPGERMPCHRSSQDRGNPPGSSAGA